MSAKIILDHQERSQITKLIKEHSGQTMDTNGLRQFLKKYSDIYYSIKAHGVNSEETLSCLKEALANLG